MLSWCGPFMNMYSWTCLVQIPYPEEWTLLSCIKMSCLGIPTHHYRLDHIFIIDHVTRTAVAEQRWSSCTAACTCTSLHYPSLQKENGETQKAECGKKMTVGTTQKNTRTKHDARWVKKKIKEKLNLPKNRKTKQKKKMHDNLTREKSKSQVHGN